MDKYPIGSIRGLSGLRESGPLSGIRQEPTACSERTPLLRCALNDLDMHVTGLVSALEMLEARLGPVCSPQPPICAQEKELKQPEVLLPAVGEEIRANTRRIEQQAERVRRILSVLEV